jgi:hypothetical protein
MEEKGSKTKDLGKSDKKCKRGIGVGRHIIKCIKEITDKAV